MGKWVTRNALVPKYIHERVSRTEIAILILTFETPQMEPFIVLSPSNSRPLLVPAKTLLMNYPG